MGWLKIIDSNTGKTLAEYGEKIDNEIHINTWIDPVTNENRWEPAGGPVIVSNREILFDDSVQKELSRIAKQIINSKTTLKP